MPLPSFRHSKSKVRRRRSHDALKLVVISKCAKCGAPALSHRVCKVCGVYSDRQVKGGMEEVKKTLAKKTKVAKKTTKAEAPGAEEAAETK